MRDTTQTAPKLVKVLSKDMQDHLNLCNDAPFKYRAAQANRPTAPRKRWAWGVSMQKIESALTT